MELKSSEFWMQLFRIERDQLGLEAPKKATVHHQPIELHRSRQIRLEMERRCEQHLAGPENLDIK